MEEAEKVDKKNDAAILERRAYQRAWRAKNRDRVRQYNADYWRRRAARQAEKRAKQNAAHENDPAGRTAHSGD